ncbi:MAG: DNA/RNA nuclease SfsA [Alphaproteobacteria bacterium]|nr:DNA/RNA nuclease SfsA [Alphaproteobacteria bacterium]
MEYNYNLIQASVIKVYNNLIIDVELENGQIEQALCGAFEISSICKPHTRVLLKRTSNRKRLVKYNIAFVYTPEGLVFSTPKYNRILFKEAFDKKLIPELNGYTDCKLLRSEDGSNGLDFRLTGNDGKQAFVFVTSLYLKKNGCAIFPQSINFFEMRMLEEMNRKQLEGAETYVFMLVPREDCEKAKFVWNLNPPAAAKIFDAAQNGLIFLCYGCKLKPNNIEVDKKLDILYV